MELLTNLITTLLNGLSIGGVYALIALGYTMVYGIAKMLNFAHGDIIMVGGYTIYVFMTVSGHPIIGIAMAIVFCALLGITVEKLAYKPLRGSSPLAVLITAIGVSYMLQSIAQIIFGSASKFVNLSEKFGLGKIKIGSFGFDEGTVITLGVSIVIMVLLSLFVKFTKTGRAMVAVSEDKGAAQLMGINVNNIITVTFAIGSALAAVASVFYLIKSPALSNTLGSMPGIKAFTAAVIGGIGSIPGAMVGGILLGIIECICAYFPAVAPYTTAIEFTILIVLLLVRPSGILGKKRREKV